MIAESSQTLYLNFSSIDSQPNTNFLKEGSLSFGLLSTAGIYFRTFYVQPSALISETLYQENVAGSTTDVPVFSAQNSLTQNTSIIEYIWTLNQSSTYCQIESTVAFSYRPSIFVGPQCPTAFHTIQGPFTVSLTIEDSYGLISSATMIFPNDPNIP